MNFLNKIEKFSSNICLINNNKERMSYEQILKKGEKISKGLENKSLVLILAKNHVDFFISYINFYKKGLVQMLLDPNISSNALNEIIKTYNPNYILLPNSRVKDFSFDVLHELSEHKILKININKQYSINKDLSLLLSTSGSTGSKKFVKISYENIYENTKSIIKFLNINQNHKTITTMPPFYTYGLSIINTHLYEGASIVVTDLRAIEKNFWKLMLDEKVLSFGGVPFFFEILKKIKFDQMYLPSLKYFTQAGGALKKDLIKYFLNYSEKNKKKFIIMYGQTEATARMSYLPFAMAKKKICSIGVPIPGGKIDLKKNNKFNYRDGEIVYRGKNVSMGYANNVADLESGDKNKGILYTGDLAKRDKDGYFYITGRKSRNIKLFGHRVNLDELEKMLIKANFKCICHGVENMVTIFFSDKTYNNNVINLLSNKTKIHKKCFKMKFINEFPLNENGKISYKKLEKFL